jgi:hypothetical protein
MEIVSIHISETWGIVNIEMVLTEWNISIVGIIVLYTTEPDLMPATIYLSGLVMAGIVGVTPNNTACYKG